MHSPLDQAISKLVILLLMSYDPYDPMVVENVAHVCLYEPVIVDWTIVDCEWAMCEWLPISSLPDATHTL